MVYVCRIPIRVCRIPIRVVTQASAQLFGRFYPLAAPFLGLLGGFISGSETSSIAMLTGLHLSTAESIGAAVFIASLFIVHCFILLRLPARPTWPTRRGCRPR
jgi:hypothetical protein